MSASSQKVARPQRSGGQAAGRARRKRQRLGSALDSAQGSAGGRGAGAAQVGGTLYACLGSIADLNCSPDLLLRKAPELFFSPPIC